MNEINFTNDEVTALHDVLKNYLSELHTEISYTDDRVFKAALKKRQDILRNAFLRLAAAVEQVA